MSELTIKAIEQLLDKKLDEKLGSKLTPITTAMAKLATSEELRGTERRLMKHGEDLQAELARMVAGGFEDVQKRLDVKDLVYRHQKALEQISQKLDLHFEL